MQIRAVLMQHECSAKCGVQKEKRTEPAVELAVKADAFHLPQSAERGAESRASIHASLNYYQPEERKLHEPADAQQRGV